MPEESSEPGDGAAAQFPIPARPIEYAKPTTPAAKLASGITRGDVAALAVRLAGIYLIISALPTLVFVAFSSFSRGGRDWVVGFYLAYDAVFIGVGAFAVIKAAMIAGWLLPRSTVGLDVPPSSGAPQQLQAVALSIVGVVLAASSLPQLAAAVVRDRQDLLMNLIAPGTELLVGLMLFFRSKRISHYWERLPAVPPAGDDPAPL